MDDFEDNANIVQSSFERPNYAINKYDKNDISKFEDKYAIDGTFTLHRRDIYGIYPDTMDDFEDNVNIVQGSSDIILNKVLLYADITLADFVDSVNLNVQGV
jgi:hypothetical protein